MVRPGLVTALRRYIEIPVYPEELFTAAAETRVGVKDLTGVILEEHTIAGKVLEVCGPCRCFLVIVESVTGRNLLGCEGDVEIAVEIRVLGRDPGEFPPHAFAHDLDLLDRRARHGGVGDVMILKMLEDSFEVIHFE